MAVSVHLDDDIDEAGEGAAAAGGHAGGAFLLAGMVQQQHTQPAAGQPLQRRQRLHHQGGVTLVAAGQERRQRIDHRQRQAVAGVQLDQAVEQGQPLLEGRLAAERPAQPADMPAEVELPPAARPLLGTFFGHDHRLARGHRPAGQLAAAGEPGEQHREQRRLARFPAAGQQRDRPGFQVAVPQPGERRLPDAPQVVRPELVRQVARWDDWRRKRVGHGSASVVNPCEFVRISLGFRTKAGTQTGKAGSQIRLDSSDSS